MYASPFTFAGRELSLDDADYAILGIPYDSSQSYRIGSRFAPNAIRGASREIEGYDIEEGRDLSELKICDLGDVAVSFGNFGETCRRVEETLKDVIAKGTIPICLGGEHTISYCVTKVLSKGFVYLVLDAHLDFRDSYLGERFSHACVTRRVGEEIGIENVMVVGVRSASKEELDDAQRLGLDYVGFFDYERNPETAMQRVKSKIEGRDIYLSLDLDVMDPKEALGVCNPEPPGLGYRDLLYIFNVLKDCNLIGADIVEVTPLYDNYTPILASKILFKILALPSQQ